VLLVWETGGLNARDICNGVHFFTGRCDFFNGIDSEETDWMAVIARVTPDDLPTIWAVQQAAFRPEADYLKVADTVPLRETLDEIKEKFPNGVFLKAVDETGKIVGSVRGMPSNDSTVLVCKLAVLPENQRQGIGRKLIEALVAELPGKDFELTVSDTYLQNGQFYQKLGFVETKRGLDDGGIPILYLRRPATT
jgi:predicted N-acetyltransferase YhbS